VREREGERGREGERERDGEREKESLDSDEFSRNQNF
jgi:hypothetical protein